MTSSASSVGPLLLPLPPGAPNSAIDDPMLSGLGRFLAFWLNYDLNPKLASLQTSRDDGTPVDIAVPTGNLFIQNPLKPNGFFTRPRMNGAAYPLPALYLWDEADKRAAFSQLHGMRARAVQVMWIFEEAVLPGWDEDRYGLRSAACATLFRAIEQGWHEGYITRDHIAVQLDLAGHGIVYQGSQRLFLAPRVDAVAPGDQPIVRAYPCALAQYLAYELEDGKTGLPSDVAQDLQVKIGVNEQGDVQNPLPVGTRIVPAPPYETTT